MEWLFASYQFLHLKCSGIKECDLRIVFEHLEYRSECSIDPLSQFIRREIFRFFRRSLSSLRTFRHDQYQWTRACEMRLACSVYEIEAQVCVSSKKDARSWLSLVLWHCFDAFFASLGFTENNLASQRSLHKALRINSRVASCCNGTTALASNWPAISLES